MTTENDEKSISEKQPSDLDVAVNKTLENFLSFNDPNIISLIMKQLGWSCCDEIYETLSVVRQNINLGAKIAALRHLRKLLHDAAESSRVVTKVSKTIPVEDGSQVTFSAKHIAEVLKPLKQVESKIIEEINDVQRDSGEQTKFDRGCYKRKAVRERDQEFGNIGGDEAGRADKPSSIIDPIDNDSPCIQHRPPSKGDDIAIDLTQPRRNSEIGEETCQ